MRMNHDKETVGDHYYVSEYTGKITFYLTTDLGGGGAKILKCLFL